MGRNFAPGFPYQRTSDSLFGDHNLQKREELVPGRRTMPGGPLMPRLPDNPYAELARQIARQANPRPPRKPNDMF